MRWLKRLFQPHNPRSAGCRYFNRSFDTLAERCEICEVRK